ncbi:MAG: 4a-hydroxytetrahydrobiopterin dehydratase, partial [Candidatus Magasanikbacteria bacterium]|nr:4a-hydroxytetrahydrobiopterin dehydratase [Candidatus Magasanikbacteria bacterium]
ARERVEELLRDVYEWSADAEYKKIERVFKFKDFKEAMVFVNHVADIAEAEGHHPDITINWNKVALSLSTHSIGGLSENDFIVAAKINALS